MRTVKTSSGATAVQLVYSYHRGSRKIEHIGSVMFADDGHRASHELVEGPRRDRSEH